MWSSENGHAVQRLLVTVNARRAYSWSGRVTAMILLCNPPTHAVFSLQCSVVKAQPLAIQV